MLIIIMMKTGTSWNPHAYVDGDDGCNIITVMSKSLPEPCEREWGTGEKIDGVHGVSVKPLRM